MKRKYYTLHTLALCFGLACLFNLPACYKSSASPAPIEYTVKIISEDSFSLYKADRFIGNCFLTDDSEIGYLIIHGNK